MTAASDWFIPEHSARRCFESLRSRPGTVHAELRRVAGGHVAAFVRRGDLVGAVADAFGALERCR